MNIEELTKLVRIKRYFYFSYGSALRDFSAILTLPKSVFSSDQDRLSLLTSVLELEQSKRYTSTQEKAWLLQQQQKLLKNTNDQIKVKINDAEINRKKRIGFIDTPIC